MNYFPVTERNLVGGLNSGKMSSFIFSIGTCRSGSGSNHKTSHTPTSNPQSIRYADRTEKTTPVLVKMLTWIMQHVNLTILILSISACYNTSKAEATTYNHQARQYNCSNLNDFVFESFGPNATGLFHGTTSIESKRVYIATTGSGI